MAIEAIVWALKDAPVDDPAAALILVALADRANDDGTDAYPSRKWLAERGRCSISTVARRLRQLEESGVIRRGDQSILDGKNIPPDRRPVVWDLCLWVRRVSLNGGSTGASDVSTGANDVSPVIERRVTGDTQTVLNLPEPSLTVLGGSKPSRRAKYSDEFERWWKAYPKSRDKSVTWKRYEKARESVSAEHLLFAAQEYAKECEANGTEDRFIKHSQGWLSACRWENYPYVPLGSQVEALVAEGKFDRIPGLLGVEVVPPWVSEGPMWAGDVSLLEERSAKDAWWRSWWESEGKNSL